MKYESLFARVENGEVTQFPIYGYHHGASDENVYPVKVEKARPEDSRDIGYKLNLKVDGKEIVGAWEAYEKTESQKAMWDSTQEYELNTKKDMLITMLNDARESLSATGVVFDGMRFQTKEGDRQKIHLAAQSALVSKVTNQPFSKEWIAEDNSVVSLDADKMIALSELVTKREEELVFRAKAVKDKVRSAKTESELPDVMAEMRDSE